ncbi:MAG: DNRLRE domain-containing protein, partial [Planctomycetes bacterium]|nr:DNRLRE domain-containing protein [Planctomycetota bacterium]
MRNGNLTLTLTLTLAGFFAIFGSRWIAAASRSDWAEGSAGGEDGATRDYYNRAGLLSWKNSLGDWRDASSVEQGDDAYATAVVSPDRKGAFVEWDVTRLAREWAGGKVPNQGFFLRRLEGGGECHFASREHGDASQRPQLVITAAGASDTLSPEADTFLEPSTYRGQGRKERLRVGARNHALIRFRGEDIAKGAPVEKAVLRLVPLEMYGGGPAVIGVFRSSQGHDRPDSKVRSGLAADHRGDRGIEADPAVIFFADFESETWADGWTHVAPRGALDTVDADAERKFEPLDGKALRVKLAEGENTALNTLLKLREKTGGEPEEIYFRYYLRFAGDWNQTVQGGKMPGISGTYGVAGWGGR